MPEQDSNDQKRIFTPGQAIKSGSSMLVIGRPITCSRDPIRAIEEIILNITKEQNYGKLKICGITDFETLEVCKEVEFLGLVFYQKSPRFIDAFRAKEISNYINQKSN